MTLLMEAGSQPKITEEIADLAAISAIKESASIELKENGNQFVRKGKKYYSDAIDCYTRAINQKALSDLENSTDLNEVVDGKDEEGEDESEDEELADGDEDESVLYLAWKMLDVARAIIEKFPGDTVENVDILLALAEVALEREDVETSLSDYLLVFYADD